MKKEALNTFEKGMVKDLHPLTTPNNVLTDALNATHITYNGNEGILQNDMGNVKIKHALLKAGYVPVGMKEHGGIIYVAAYNPKTGKGQVGSFPSPKQLWEGEDWTVNSPSNILNNVSISPNFYDGNFIVNEVYKQEIFSNNEDGPRIFHPGDKFLIGIDQSIYNKLEADINNDYIDVQLGVVKSDGSIEVMRTWSITSPDNIFYIGNASAEGAMNKQNTKVFDASSSGQLLLIINMHTLDSFSISKSYSKVNDNIQVKFIGEGKKNGVSYNSENDSELKLTKQVGNNALIVDQDNITVQGTSGTQNLTIYPNVPFGVIKRMGRPITINFDKIKDNQDEFGEWRFFVTQDYVKIGWSYDFYNLDGSKEIEYIRMYFHLLEDGYTQNNKEAIPHIEFQREYYSGNFEDYINYSDVGLKYKHIYIVEIVKKFTDENVENIIDFKMLYLSPLYNSNYNGFYENKSIGVLAQDTNNKLEYQRHANDSVDFQLQGKLNISSINSITKVKKPGENTFEHTIPTTEIDSNLYTKELTNDEFNNLSSQVFTTRVENDYTGSIDISGDITNISDLYIGHPRNTLVQEILSSYQVNVSDLEEQKGWENQPLNKVFPEESSPSATIPTVQNTSVLNNVLKVNLSTFSNYRLVQGFCSNLLSESFDTKGLKPLYSPSYTSDRKQRIAPYFSTEQTLCISGEGDDDETMWYNSTITQTGNVVNGPDSGGGPDDGGLYTAANLMGKPMTNILVGVHGDQSEIEWGSLKRESSISNDLGFPSDEDDEGGNTLAEQSDNWMVACWKFTDGDTRLVNLATPKNRPVDSSVKWPRLDVMLRCILSQIFIVNRISRTINYITTNSRFYRYEKSSTKLTLTLNSNLQANTSDIMVNENEQNFNQILSTVWGYANGNINVNGKSYPFVNLIPEVAINFNNQESIEVELPEYQDLDQILEYYQGVSYKYSDDSDGYDVKAMYCLDMSANNAFACAHTHTLGGVTLPQANKDGTYEWTDMPNCIKLTSDLKIYRWNDSSQITFPSFATYFTTRAQQQDWQDVVEGEENEILGQVTNNFAIGYWTNGSSDDNAPDMYYKHLYSSSISPYKDRKNGLFS